MTGSSDDSAVSMDVGGSGADLWLLATIAVVPFVGLLSSMALTPFLPSVAGELGTSVSLAGQVPALGALLAMAFGLVVGPVADAFGHRRVLVVGIVALILGALGTALAPTYAALLLVAVFTALGLAIASPVTLAIAGVRYSGERRRRAVSLGMAGASGAVIAGIPILTLVASGFNWRGAFLALALLTLGSLGLSLLAVPPDKPRSGKAPELRSVLRAYVPLLRHRPTLALYGWHVLNSASTWSLWTFFGAFLVQVYGVTDSDLGLAYTVVGCGIFAGSLMAGGRMGGIPLWTVVIGTSPLLGLLRASAVGLLPGPAITAGILAVAALGTGILGVAGTALLLEESPAGRATTTTVNTAAASAGRALGASAGGLMLAAGGYSALAICPPVLGLAAALCALVGMLTRARESQRKVAV